MKKIKLLLIILSTQLSMFANMQQDIQLTDGGMDLFDSWFTIAFFIAFPIIIALLYFFLKRKQSNDDAEEDISQSK